MSSDWSDSSRPGEYDQSRKVRPLWHRKEPLFENKKYFVLKDTKTLGPPVKSQKIINQNNAVEKQNVDTLMKNISPNVLFKPIKTDLMDHIN